MFYNVCKLYGQTLTRNELFHWLLINFFFIKTGTADIIEQNLLLNLLSNESFVITSEFDLYCMLKNWMLQDLASNDQLAAYQTSDKDFLKTPVGENYQKIFSHLRMTSLLAYTDKIESIFNDKIIPIEVLYETLYGMQRRMLNVTELLNDNQINRFRIARKFIKSDEQTFTTDFFSSGIDLKFRFTSRQLSVTPERSKTAKLSHQGHFEARMQFTLFGSLVRDRCRFTTEATEPITIDLLFGIEKVIANWRKIVAFPCTLSGQIQISLKT